jgi:xanthine dehydrogenase iron-sulfur cluster and FAD-binding subunit A
MAISKLSLAVLGWKEEQRVQDIRICAGSVSAQVKRARMTEKLLKGKNLTVELINLAADKLQQEIKPITDIRSTKAYRKMIAGRLLQEALAAWMRD